ncbi:MAG: HAD family phosphatase [Candidatus Neomarinimicrobiota bacterium]
MIKNIFFDIGGVLLEVFPERILDYLRKCTGLPDRQLQKALDGDNFFAYEAGKLSDEEFFRWYQRAIPQPNNLTRDDFFQAWLQVLGEPTKTLTLARQLARSYPVWLASNTNSCHIRYGEKKGYFDGFAGKVYSFEIGVRKPSTEFFQRALDLAGAETGSSLFIDDKPENVGAAQAMGFETIHYQSDPQMKRDLDNWI